MNVSFSSPVEIDTLKLKITKQGDNSTLKIMSLSGSKTDDHVVDIVLGTDLQQGSAYTLTAVSAIGKDRSVIKDGALALKDFVTPIPLKTPETEMSAAPNPNAVLVKTGSTTPVPTVSPTTTPTPQPTVTKKPDVVVPAKELPLTGMNPLFLLIIVLPIAYIFTRKRV